MLLNVAMLWCHKNRISIWFQKEWNSKQINKPYLDKLYTDDKLDKFNQLHVVTSLFFKLCYNIIIQMHFHLPLDVMGSNISKPNNLLL